MLTKLLAFENFQHLVDYVANDTLFPHDILREHGISQLEQSFVGSMMRSRPFERLIVAQAILHDWLKPVTPHGLKTIDHKDLE
jgi:hypothetical protein